MTDNIRMFPRGNTAPKLPIVHEETCPTCKFPLADSSFGWVKEYGQHYHSERCQQRYGFCLIPCPTCSGGVEAKRSAQLINQLFHDSNIPHYARDWTFDSYPADADQEAKRETHTQITLWSAGKPTKGGLYIHGKNGQCKTSLAISALHAWLRKGRSGVFIGTSDLFSKLTEAIAASKRNEDYQDRYEASQGAKLLRLVRSVELLILDDLGVESGSKYEIKELYLILEARRSHGLFTIFTSNRDAKDLSQYWRNEKEGVFQDGFRIIDRLGEYCFNVPVAGRNQRTK
jgi:DNA replication protein DnaC